MRNILLCSLLLSAACETGTSRRAEADAGRDGGFHADASWPPACCLGRARADAGRDNADTDSTTAQCKFACGPWATAMPSAPGSLTLEGPASVVPGSIFPVVVRSSEPWTGTLSLQADVGEQAVSLVRGVGSVRLQASESSGALHVGVRHQDASADLQVEVGARPTRTVTGTLSGADLSWDPEADVLVDGSVRVPPGSTLVIAAGTRVLFSARSGLILEGELQVSGTREAPVTFFAAGEETWDEIDFAPGSVGTITWAAFGGGGGNPARAAGHSGSEPVLRVREAALGLQHVVIADNPGKALFTQDARVELADSLITRCDTGGEFSRTALHMARTHTLEIPDADGEPQDDDNDGIYLVGVLLEGGAEQTSHLEDVVIARTEDDGLDHNNAKVLVERTYIRNVRHEGIAASGGSRLEVRDTEVSLAEQGIELGYADPEVNIERAYVHDNDVGLRVGDSYDRAINGHMTVKTSVFSGNRLDVRNHSNALMGPVPGALEVHCSLLRSDEPLGTCNLSAAPPDGCGSAEQECACEALPADVCGAPDRP